MVLLLQPEPELRHMYPVLTLNNVLLVYYTYLIKTDALPQIVLFA